jgi:lysozyme
MTYIIGTDVSFWEDDASTARHIDFAHMKGSGAKFTIIKCGQKDFADRDYYLNMELAKQAGLPRGAYWFYDSRATPQSQAELWADILGSDTGELPLFADFEETYNGIYRGGNNFRLFLDRLKELIPNKEIVIYTGYYYWMDNVSTSLHGYYNQYALWIANYKVNAPNIPAPWTTWLFWQYTDTGSGAIYGTEGAVDLNYFNGDEAAFNARFGLGNVTIPPETTEETHTPTHDGVYLHIIERYGSKCVIHVIDPKIARVFVTPGPYQTVWSAVDNNDAQIGMNGGGWPNTQTPGHRSNEIWISDGTVLQGTAIDGRGYVHVNKDQVPSISKNATLPPVKDRWNVWGFDRILGENGVFNSAISDRTTKDARTGTGITADGKIVILSAEGNDRYQHGLSFPEMWNIFVEFGCVIAGNNDGGSSSAVVNTAIQNESLIIPSDGTQANVINQVLIFAVPIIGEVMKAKYTQVTNIKVMSGTGSKPQLQVGDYLFGTVGTTDMLNFDHYYLANNTRVELGQMCKATLSTHPVVTNETEPTTPTDPPVTSSVPVKLTAYFEDGTSKDYFPNED